MGSVVIKAKVTTDGSYQMVQRERANNFMENAQLSTPVTFSQIRVVMRRRGSRSMALNFLVDNAVWRKAGTTVHGRLATLPLRPPEIPLEYSDLLGTHCIICTFTRLTFQMASCGAI